jgi:hypothetical protein
MTLSSDAAIVIVDPSRGPFSLLLRLTAGTPSSRYHRQQAADTIRPNRTLDEGYAR